LEWRIRGKTIGLKIVAQSYYQIYKYKNGFHKLQGSVVQDNTKIVQGYGPIQGVVDLSKDDLARLIGDMHYTDILKIEIPLFNDISCANESLKGAIRNLKSSAEKFSTGDVRAALVDIRNAILNHLTDGGTKKQRVLKKDLRDKYMSEVPQDAITSYKKF
jgi:hypothetical protein